MPKAWVLTNIYIYILVMIGVLSSFLWCSCPVSALYSMTVSTSGAVKVDVAPSTGGEAGIAVVADEVEIVSDCRAGYTFNIVGPTDNNLYLDGDSENDDSGTYFMPVDGTNALNNSANVNKWGYSLTANNSAGVFTALTDAGAVLKTPAQTASLDSDIDSVVPIYYGTSVSGTMAPGGYTFADGNKISYQIVMDVSCAPGIHYEANGADEGVMGVQEAEAGAGVYLIPPNYSREGYGFKSWNTQPDGSGTNYGPNEYITMPDSGVLTLYANWVASAGDLQGWTGCSSLSVNDVTALTDTRDGNTYAVAKLADGKCWMVENLRLDLEGAGITEYNTNNPSSEFLEKLADVTPNNGEWCVRTASGAASDPCEREMNYNTNNLDRSLEASYNVNGIADVSWYSYGVMYNKYTANNVCPIGWKLPTGATRTLGSLSQDYHALMYAWNNNYQASSTSSTNGVDSRLAFAYPNNFTVSGSYGQTSFRGRAGLISSYDGSVKVDTAYWAVGGYMAGSGNAFRLYSSNGNIIQVSDASEVRGYNVRCVIEEGTEDFTLNYNTNGSETVIPAVTVTANKVYHFTIGSTVPQRSGYSFKWWIDKDGNEYAPGDTFTTIDADSTLYAIWENNTCNPEAETIGQAVCLQDMNSAVRATMVSKQTYTLRDARDNKQYTISLLDDGEVWMTQNLDVGRNAEMVMSSSDTDIEDSYYIIPAQTDQFVIDTDNSYSTNDYTKLQLRVGTQYGGYYSWPAAVLSDSYDSGGTNIVLASSICPAGWDLPAISHYEVLAADAGINNYSAASASPYGFVLGGYMGISGLSYAGTYGKYWTATTSTSSYYSAKYASDLTISNSSFAKNSSQRHNGHLVRCIVSNGSGTINYNANGGSGSMDSQSNVEINATTIVANGFTEANEHKQFREWNTRADGSGIAVKPGETAAKIKNDLVNGEVTLYAQWDDLYIVTFNNTDSGATVVKKTVVGGRIYLSSSWERTNYVLSGWDTDPSGQSVVYGYSGSFVPTGDVFLYSVWTPTYTVAYDGNGADSGSMNFTDGAYRAGTSVNLRGNDFAKTGYGFVGWSTNSAAVPGDGVSIIYGPRQKITLPAGGQGGTMTLYAVWVEADSNYTMQSFGANGVCSSLSVGDVVALDDARDANTYAVAKLVSGDCWMMENLRLDPTQVTINSQNTDSPTTDFISALADYPSSYDGCSDNDDPNCVDSVGLNDDNIDRSITKDKMSRKYSDGVRYNWHTATAGNGSYSNDDDDEVVGSICPSGWHLPRGSYWGEGVEGEVEALISGMGGYNSWQGLLYPNNFSDSEYWTAVSYFSGAIIYYGDDGYPGSENKIDYISMRCVAN